MSDLALFGRKKKLQIMALLGDSLDVSITTDMIITRDWEEKKKSMKLVFPERGQSLVDRVTFDLEIARLIRIVVHAFIAAGIVCASIDND